jgi:hypothetical protein
MGVPTNDWEIKRCACDIVRDGADDELIVVAARKLVGLLMRNWIDRADYRWSFAWVRQDLDDVGLVYLELECSDEGMAFQRGSPCWLVWEAIKTLQERACWPDAVA